LPDTDKSRFGPLPRAVNEINTAATMRQRTTLAA
jgi:hypothetical protein